MQIFIKTLTGKTLTIEVAVVSYLKLEFKFQISNFKI